MLRWLGAAAALMLATPLVLGLLLAGRLAAGPLTLDGLRGSIEAAASAALGGDVVVERLSLTLAPEAAVAVAVEAQGLRVADEQGRALFSAPRIVAQFSPRSLAQGRLAPDAVTIFDAAAVLTRAADGRFSFGLGAAQPDGAPSGSADAVESEGAVAAAGFDALVAQLTGAQEGPLTGLRALTLTRIDLQYVDLSARRIYRAERADLRMGAEDGALTVAGSIVVRGGVAAATAIRASGRRAPDGSASMVVRFTGVDPRDLVDQVPAVDGLQVLSAPLQGRAEVAIDPSGQLTAFDADLLAGRGAVRAGEAEMALDAGRVSFSFAPQDDRFDIRAIALRGPAGAVRGRGAMTVARAEDGAAAGVVAQLDFDELAIADPRVFASPQRFDGGAADLRATFAPTRVELAEAFLTQGPLRLNASGWAAPDAQDDWRGALDATLRMAQARQLVDLWPTGAAPGARVWLDANLEAGVIERADVAARMGPEGPRLGVAFAFRDVVAHYLRPMPPITGGRGWGEVDLQRFALALDAGEVAAPGGGVVRLRDSVMILPDLDDPLATTDVVARGDGPVDAALAILNVEPLGLPGKLDLDPRSTSGRMDTEATLRLPLLKDLRLEQIEVAVTSTIADARFSAPGVDVAVAAPRLALEADIERMRLSGDMRLNGLPARVALTETFAPAAGAPSTDVRLSGRVDVARIAELGLDPRPYVDGRLSAVGRVRRFPGGRVAFEVDLDLADATITGAALDVAKPAGAPASARLVGALDGAAAVLRQARLEAPGFMVDGALRFENGRFLGADLAEVRLDDRIDGRAEITVDPDGGLRAALTARTLDVAAFGAGGDAADDPPPREGPDLSLTLAADRLRLTETLTVRDARGEARRADGRLEAALRGRVGVGALDVAYALDAGGERVTARSADAGDLLRAAGVFQGGVGGRLRADAAVAREGGRLGLDGTLALDDFVVSEDPGLSAMLREARIDAARDSGVLFEEVRAPFRLRGDVMSVRDGVAFGPVVGLTFDGAVDLEREAVDMRGVFTPAYALNAAIGRIPILGDLLTGGRGRGLIAFNFAVEGPFADPDVSVNPLSVLTPGLLRDLFTPSSR